MPHLTLAGIAALAEEAHAGQVDQIGVAYIEHVRAVADGLAPLGEPFAAAGLLHDIVEDTPWTAERLRMAGVDPWVIDVVMRVTRAPGVGYEEMIQSVATCQQAALVKIADNAHNSHPNRAAALPPAQRARLAAKYQAARDVLWPAVKERSLRTILERVNPSLLPALPPLPSPADQP